MLNQNVARGLFLAALVLFFASNALRYPIGDLAHAGPGLFPLLICVPLLIIAGAIILQARFSEPVPLQFNPKNIALIMASLVGFVIASEYVNAIAGIIVLVFVAGLAGTTYSWMRNIKIALGLIVVAYVFQRFLGLNLRLI
ncbi:tripartite tricarboxylate transporter TctB family protein [Bosea sp. RAF48]|uniref:tripartite tricarboxylate transporter TctB family protein n=1 Tax=Bosea sp. RAF48 TaxID=3237480 RepID=UPI003F907509